MPGSNPDLGRRDVGLANRRCRFRKMLIWSRLAVFLDQSGLGIGRLYLSSGQLVITLDDINQIESNL